MKVFMTNLKTFFYRLRSYMTYIVNVNITFLSSTDRIKLIINYIFICIFYFMAGFIAIGIFYIVQSNWFIVKLRVFLFKNLIDLLPGIVKLIEIIKDIINNIRKK
jgi:hypothetical protein